MEVEKLKRIHIYDDFALYVPGLVCSLLLAFGFSTRLSSLSGATVVFGVIVLGFPIGLVVQALASAVFQPFTLKFGRQIQKRKSFDKLVEGDRKAVQEVLGGDLSPEALFTRCVTRFTGKLDSYIKFKALSDVCRSVAFMFLLTIVVSLTLLCFPSYREEIAGIARLPIRMAEVIAGYTIFVLTCFFALVALLVRSFHFVRISNDIVFDVAASESRMLLKEAADNVSITNPQV